MGTRRDGETERTQDGRRRGMAWARLAFARFCTALLGGRRATATLGLGRYPFAKMDLGKPQNTSTGTGPEGDEEEELEAGRWDERRHLPRSISPSAKRTGTNLVRLGRRLACETAASGSLPAGRSCPALGDGKDATPPVWRLFLAGRWPRPIDRHQSHDARGQRVVSASCACCAWPRRRSSSSSLQNACAKTPRAPPNKPRLHVENPGQQRHGVVRGGVQCGLAGSHRLPVLAAVTVYVAVLKFGENSFSQRMVRAGHGPVRGAIGPGARPFGVGDCDVVPELFHEHAIREIVEGWNRISLPPRAWAFPLSLFPRPRPRAAWQTCPMEQVGRWEAPGQES